MLKRLQPFAPVFIIVCGVLAYVNSFDGAFVLDDVAHIAHSTEIERLGDSLRGSSRPVTDLTFHLNYLVSGRTAADYHAVNLAIHLMAALLLYGIVQRTLRYVAGLRAVELRLPAATFAAVLWAVHPLQTQSVTYIVQRAESLMGLFYLLTLYCVIRSTDAPRRRAWLWGAVAACALGMATKAVMVTAPIAVLLYDRMFLAGSVRRALRARGAMYAGLAATWAVVALLAFLPNESSATVGFDVPTITPLGYLATQPGVILHYLKQIVWPGQLVLDYAWPPAVAAKHIVWPGLVVGGLLALAVVLVIRRHPAGFCLAWFCITLAPTSSFIPLTDYAFEHRLYLALAGPVTLFTGGLTWMGARWPATDTSRRTIGVSIVALFCACALALGLRTADRNRDYASSVRLARSNARAVPHNFRARMMLIQALQAELRFDEAYGEARGLIRDMRAARGSDSRMHSTIAGDPETYLPRAFNAAGKALLCLGRNAEAIPFLDRALKLDPELSDAGFNRAIALLGLGRRAQAYAEIERSLGRGEASSKGETLAGMAAIHQGEYAQALARLDRAVRLDADNMIARLELAWLLATVPTAGLRDGPRALRLAREIGERTNGTSVRLWDVLAAAHAACGQYAEAERIVEHALRQVGNPEDEVDPETRVSSIRSTRPALRARQRAYQAGRPWVLKAETE